MFSDKSGNNPSIGSGSRLCGLYGNAPAPGRKAGRGQAPRPAAFRPACLLLALLLAAAAASGCGSQENLTPEQALSTLDALLTKVTVTHVAPRMDISDMQLSEPGAELPDISNYPFSVEGDAPIDVEIFASTEKSGPNMDGWINEIAARFNRMNFDVGGRGVSVSIRPVASGLATDYIVTGRYVPDAFSPANEMWGDMLSASGVRAELVEKRIAGNTAGILMKKSSHESFVKKYGEAGLANVLEAVMAGDVLLGYTNPYASSTGLNILTAMLQTFDADNPLSDAAVRKLEEFQTRVPPVAYTTAQMRESAKNGVLDTMIMEYQAYINEPTLKDYVFTPCGVRHDNPVYALNDITPEKRAALLLFTDFCKTEASQKEAARFGFNANEGFQGDPLALDGAQLFSAQRIWKENKDSGRPVVAIFVADVSGSMGGTPIMELRTSLLNATQYITETNYIGLISYSDDVYVNLPIEQFSPQHKAYFSGAVRSLSEGGGTATYNAVLAAARLLLEKQAELPDAKLMMFVLSDGIQNSGYGLDRIIGVIDALNIPIHTIGYNTDLDELQRLSSINEASNVRADESNVVYNLKNIFNAQM
jgi:Ca-activated chloride channel family protein